MTTASLTAWIKSTKTMTAQPKMETALRTVAKWADIAEKFIIFTSLGTTLSS
jgi:cysteine sulfinate desulfinase/cysteine desulfurase-like protein